MRRSSILLVPSMILALLVTAAVQGSAAVGARGSAMPANFRAQSISWISPDQGWLLGSAPCGQTICTTVDGTTDGGVTWNTLGTIGAPLTYEQATGVTEVRFADELNGWAFGPALWKTTDGGATWTRQTLPGDGRQVRALAGDPEGVYLVVSPCRFGFPCNQPVTLWRTMPGQGSWTQVSLTLRATLAPVFLAVNEVVAYLGIQACQVDCAPEPDILDSTVDGQNWSSRPDPCVPADTEVLYGIAPISGTQVALLCQTEPQLGSAAKRILRSKDAGQTTVPGGKTPLEGTISQIAATPSGTLAVSSFYVVSDIYLNTGGRTWTTALRYSDAGQGWNDITFVDDQVGFIIHAAATCCGGHGNGKLWETQDGGVTWAPA